MRTFNISIRDAVTVLLIIAVPFLIYYIVHVLENAGDGKTQLWGNAAH